MRKTVCRNKVLPAVALGLAAAVTTGRPATAAVQPDQPDTPEITVVQLGQRPGMVATLVNDHGLVAGAGIGIGSPREIVGFVWRDGTSVELPGSVPTAVNNQGHVVGAQFTAPAPQAFRWVDGVQTPLGFLGGTADSRFSTASDVNEAGQVVGASTTDSGEVHAFLWQDGAMTDLGTLGGGRSEAVAVNDRGQVVGVSRTAAGDDHAFLWQDGVMTDLGTLGGHSSTATDINNAGQIVGRASTPDGRQHAFLWTPGYLGQPGQMTDLQADASDSAATVKINESGQVLVDAVSDPDFVWANGSRTEIGPPYTTTLSRVINDRGQVVGASFGDSGMTAFRWSGRDTLGLTAPGVLSSDAFAANTRGDVVGTAEITEPDGTVRQHAVLWRILDG